jgi:hypothetical protein
MDKIMWVWANRASRVTHAYIAGPGAGDSSLCGVIMDGRSKPSMMENDPKCYKCKRVIESDTSLPNLPHCETCRCGRATMDPLTHGV